MLTAENISNGLWLLIIIPLSFLILFALRWKKSIISQLGDSFLTNRLVASFSSKKFLFKNILILSSIFFLVIALINFRRADSSEKIKLTGTDLMIALDVSNSMSAKDIQPSRLEKAKLLISKLIDRLAGNRVGLVVFAGAAYLQMPLTTDASAAKLFLSTITPDLVPQQGTNISEALRLCNRSLNTEEKKYKSILLISDGEDHDDASIETAKALKNNGVIINTIGIGSPDGAPIVDAATNDFKHDEQGNVVISKLNENELKEIAKETNGEYQLLGETENAANRIVSTLMHMDKKSISDSTLTNYTTFYYWFVLAALVLLTIELLTGERYSQNKKKAFKFFSFIAFTILSANVLAQKENTLIKKGNDAYRQQKFKEAEQQYSEALKTNGANKIAAFNMGNTKFKSNNIEDAVKEYDAVLSAPDKSLSAKGFYNKGVSLVKQKKLPEAIDAFKQSIRQNPDDNETRENLQRALNELKQQQQKQDNKQQQQKNNNDQQKQQQEKQQQKQQQQEPKMNKEEAEQKLEALRQEEKKLQEKLNQRQKNNTKASSDKDW